MNRKIIKQGLKAYTITLPISWIRQNNLEIGSEVVLNETNNKIIISNEQTIFIEKKIDFNIQNEYLLQTKKPYRLIQRIYSSLFKAGYTEIKFHFSKPEIAKYLKKRTDLFIGCEIIDEDKNYIIIKSIVNPNKEEFKNLYNRAFLIILTISKQLISNLKSNDFDILDLNEFERTNGKITDYLKRLLKLTTIVDSDNLSYYYSLIAENERLCDEYKYLIINLAKEKKVSKELISILEKLDEGLNLMYKLINKYDINLVKSISVLRENLINHIDSKLDSSKYKLPLFFTRNIMIKIYELCEAILEMNI